MEPSDAKSIAESLIQTFAKDIPVWAFEDVAYFDHCLRRSEILEIEDDVLALIENAKITVEFEEN